MKMLFSLILTIATSICCFSQQLYTPTDAGSRMHFVIKNFGIKTGGDIMGVKGAIHFDPAKPGASDFVISVEANTIDTDSEMRDEHLKESDYFDAKNYPTINFKSTKVTASTTAGRFYIFGNLTMKGITKPVEFGFSATPKDGGYLFEGEFEINRRDFNVGDKSVSLQDNVKVNLSVFAKK